MPLTDAERKAALRRILDTSPYYWVTPYQAAMLAKLFEVPGGGAQILKEVKAEMDQLPRFGQSRGIRG
jgi:hypothetical protein